MPHKVWLQSLADMLSRFPEAQAPSQRLLADVQLVLDEAIALVITHGGQLPGFIVEASRIEGVYQRLGPIRLDELSSQSMLPQAVEALIPPIAKLCTEFDVLNRRAAELAGPP